MTTEGLIEKYTLKEADFWTQSFGSGPDRYIIKHDAVMRIAVSEQIVFSAPDWVTTGDNGIYVLTVTARSKKKPEIEIWSCGESNRNNTRNSVEKVYPVAMAEKRAKDRATLALLDWLLETPLENKLYSEIEAADFEKKSEADDFEDQGSEPLNQQEHDQRVLLLTIASMQEAAQKVGGEGTAEIIVLCQKSFGHGSVRDLTVEQLKEFIQHLTVEWSLDNDQVDACCNQAAINIKDYQ